MYLKLPERPESLFLLAVIHKFRQCALSTIIKMCLALKILMIAVFWYVAGCSLVETDRSFGGKYCVYVQAVPVSDRSVASYHIQRHHKQEDCSLRSHSIENHRFCTVAGNFLSLYFIFMYSLKDVN